MYDTPLYEITSHIAGKNATVRVYPDRIEWERGKTISGGKMTAAVMTLGMSTVVTGLRTRKGAGTEMIPMRSISSVTTKRDSMTNDIVSVITTGNTIDMRCSRKEAEQLKSLILRGINGQLVRSSAPIGQPTAPAAVTSPPPPPPPPPPSAEPARPADWYPDPRGEQRLRYWDGSQWTAHTAP